MGALHGNRRAWLITALAMIALVFVVRVLLSWVGPFPGDRSALQRAIHYVPPGTLINEITGLWANLGTALAAVLTLAVAARTLWRSDGPRGVTGLALAASVVIANAILKLFLSPTPLWALHRFLGAGNFPSGHVAYATAVFGYLGVAGAAHGRREVAAVCALLVCGMGPARVLDGSHLVSDAVAGYLLGAGWLILTLLTLDALDRRRRRRRPHRQSGSVRAASASPPVAARASSE